MEENTRIISMDIHPVAAEAAELNSRRCAHRSRACHYFQR
jgi:hypothetical protein